MPWPVRNVCAKFLVDHVYAVFVLELVMCLAFRKLSSTKFL